MMTRTTLKALWVGGGGVLATWLAVSPNNGVTPHAPSAAVRSPAASSRPVAEELNEQATRLRERTAALALRPSTRNPFTFNARKSATPSATARERVLSAVVESAIPAAPPGPILKLSGVAQKAGKRTVIITGDGQIYLAGEGDSVAGRYTVMGIDPTAVLLRDAEGAELRLVLPH